MACSLFLKNPLFSVWTDSPQAIISQRSTKGVGLMLRTILSRWWLRHRGHTHTAPALSPLVLCTHWTAAPALSGSFRKTKFTPTHFPYASLQTLLKTSIPWWFTNTWEQVLLFVPLRLQSLLPLSNRVAKPSRFKRSRNECVSVCSLPWSAWKANYRN